MKGKRIYGVGRAGKFSPNCENNDGLILHAVARELVSHGFLVDEIPETDLNSLSRSDIGVFFSMARSREALEILKEKENAGAIVINSPSCLLVNNRSNITRIFAANGIAMPESEFISKGHRPSLTFPFWLKRGDACAQSRYDVTYVADDETLHEALASFAARGITDIVVNEHLCGDLVKFYGVYGTDFFYTLYPTKNGKSGKFGLEQFNNEIHNYGFSCESLHAACTNAARLLGFAVYGGDCIVGQSGEFRIIDFNDWPSFSCCRDEAAKVIAAKIEECASNLKVLAGTGL